MLAKTLDGAQRLGEGLSQMLLPLGFRMLVLASLLTLLFNPPLMFSDASTGCTAGVTLSLFCQGISVPLVRWAAIVVCVINLWPRHIPGGVLLQWAVAHSIRRSISSPDGGDSITANLLFLLVPLSLCAPHVFNLRDRRFLSATEALILRMTLALIGLQMAVVYFDAAITKAYVPEWRDGTALFYILTMPAFGDFQPTSLLWPLISTRVVALLTYGTLFLEFSLAFAWLGTERAKALILVAGLSFHALIALVMGLPTFGLAMGAGLLLYLHPFKPVEGESLSSLTRSVFGPSSFAADRGSLRSQLNS